jgi:hypothetical protein
MIVCSDPRVLSATLPADYLHTARLEYLCVGVLRVYNSPVFADILLRSYIVFLQMGTLSKWAMLGSNQRPLPCEGESSGSPAFSIVHKPS